MNRTIRCAHCRCRVLPNPRVKPQRFCANQAGQRARKAQWQRDKLATDPDDRANQRDCQPHWQHQHPQSWRQYRQQRADYRARHRLLQQHRDRKRRLRPLAKRAALEPVTSMPPGIDHLIPAVGPHLAKMDVLSQKCHGIPSTERSCQRGHDRPVLAFAGASRIRRGRMLAKSPLAPERVRTIPGSFAWLAHRF
jgi:hypothetical protein